MMQSEKCDPKELYQYIDGLDLIGKKVVGINTDSFIYSAGVGCAKVDQMVFLRLDDGRQIGFDVGLGSRFSVVTYSKNIKKDDEEYTGKTENGDVISKFVNVWGEIVGFDVMSSDEIDDIAWHDNGFDETKPPFVKYLRIFMKGGPLLEVRNSGDFMEVVYGEECPVCGEVWEEVCRNCGWEFDYVEECNGGEFEPPNYLKAVDYRELWEFAGEDLTKMHEWWEMMSGMVHEHPEFWHILDKDKKDKLYNELLAELKERIGYEK